MGKGQTRPREGQKVTALLSIGCNLGDCEESLTAAVRELAAREGTAVGKVSSVYLTEPVGNPDQPDFLNIAVTIETSLKPHELLAVCGAIERELGGREGRVPMGPRTIDIDILLYGDALISTPDLVVPHPRMLERAFVLVPLAEIAPDAALPGGGTVSSALEALSDEHMVEKKGPLPI